MVKLGTSFMALVVVLATGFCAQLKCESERRLRALEERADDNWQRDLRLGRDLDTKEGVHWWCTAPALGPAINRSLPGRCEPTRSDCQVDATIIGSTCIATDAPFCFDILVGGDLVAAQCYFDLPTCEDSRRRNAYASGSCHRAR